MDRNKHLSFEVWLFYRYMQLGCGARSYHHLAEWRLLLEIGLLQASVGSTDPVLLAPNKLRYLHVISLLIQIPTYIIFCTHLIALDKSNQGSPLNMYRWQNMQRKMKGGPLTAVRPHRNNEDWSHPKIPHLVDLEDSEKQVFYVDQGNAFRAGSPRAQANVVTVAENCAKHKM